MSRLYHQEYYQKHRDKLKERSRQYYWGHREQIRMRAKEFREKHKDEIAEKAKEYERTHREQEAARKKRWRDKVKAEVLTYYGGGRLACVLCGEDSVACLTVDHIAGGGRKHRKELKEAGVSLFYPWLRRMNYPDGYRTLCMNCQLKVLYAT